VSTTTLTPEEAVEWVRAHKASVEMQPLLEVHRGEKVPVGFELNLFALLGRRNPEVTDRLPEMQEIHRVLRQLLEGVVPGEHPVARLEVEPFRAAVKLRAQAEFAPEVQLSGRVVRRTETFTAVPAEARNALAFVEKGLHDLGFRRGGG
jgi:hypothetical protein